MQKGVTSFEQMKNLPKKVTSELEKDYFISFVKLEKKFVSKVDGTVKYLFSLNDGNLIESVVMKYKHGYSICISSQCGCNMGCSFCASTIGGKARDLTAGEMLSQIYFANWDLNITISNVVMMGMGEPLDNFEQTVRFLELVSAPGGLNIGMRHISLSTCGVVDKIYELAKLNLQLTLSVSLHAPNDELRGSIMPINRKWNVEQLIKACKDYIKVTNRRISFEYALIKGFNDSNECARELAKLLKGMLAHINLIPANPVHENKFVKPENNAVQNFANQLNSLGLNATVRRTLGSDIDASCGQLKARHKE